MEQLAKWSTYFCLSHHSLVSSRGSLWLPLSFHWLLFSCSLSPFWAYWPLCCSSDKLIILLPQGLCTYVSTFLKCWQTFVLSLQAPFPCFILLDTLLPAIIHIYCLFTVYLWSGVETPREQGLGLYSTLYCN